MKTNTRTYLQLGRSGDVLNVLPLLWRDFKTTGIPSALVVQKDFATAVEAASYVDLHVWDGDWKDVAGAYRYAQEVADGGRVFCTQIYGRDMIAEERCASFDRENWARVPDAPPWGTLPLVFDSREPAGEAAVTDFLRRGSRKPYVICCFEGLSSPFSHGFELFAYLRSAIGAHVDLINLSGYRAARLTHLLGLIEGAYAVLTIDTAILHLCHALPAVPVVRLVSREPSKWHAPAWRPQHRARFYYDECPGAFPHVASALEYARTPGQGPRIVHTFANWLNGPTGETLRRIKLARETWDREAGTLWERYEYVRGAEKRDSTLLGDAQGVPFLRDLLGELCQRAKPRPEDIIAVTNGDVCFAPGLTGWVLDVTSRAGAAYTHRWDFRRLNAPLRGEDAVRSGKWYPGSDAFFFTAEWWAAHGEELPDVLLGREHVDELLRQLIKRHGGLPIPAAIYHEKHASFWESAEEREKNRGNQHNRKLARAWFQRTGYGPDDYLWWQIPGGDTPAPIFLP